MTSSSDASSGQGGQGRGGFHLRPTRRSDLAALTDLCTLAFQHDSHTLFKAHERQQRVEMSVDHLEYWVENDTQKDGEKDTDGEAGGPIDDKKLEVITAVDDATGDCVGYVAWGKFNFKGEWPEDPTASEPIYDLPTSPPSTAPGVDHLEYLTDRSMAEWQNSVNTRGSRGVMYIYGISVHPAHQGKGIGRALIRYGTRKADEAQVKAWVHASDNPASVAAFQKEGFVEQEWATLKVELDEYASRPVEPENVSAVANGRWGSYTWRHMLREPQTSS